MSNRKLYKDAMSGVHHSDKAVERIFEMTIDKKANKGLIFKRIATVVMVLVLFVSGGFGTNAIIQNSRANQPLGVMVAYADEFMKVESGTEQTIFKSIYIAPANDKEKCQEQRAKADKDYRENRDAFENLAKNNEVASLTGVGVCDYADEDGNITINIYTTGAGSFAVNKTNYKNVKSFTVENESEDGFLQFEWSGTADLILSETEESYNPDYPYPFIGHNFTLTGDELRESQKDFNKYGYICEWNFAPECRFGCDGKYGVDFDVTSIKDKITFTFEYNDGTTESASVNIGFDSNGHMVVS